jgi:flavin reductase
MAAGIKDGLLLAPDRFREAMSRVGSAVHIVTTGGAAGSAGITANAVTSVTAEPPTMLFCLNKTSRAAPLLIENGVFCINTLASAHQELSDIFAGRTDHSLEERFAAAEWSKLTTGAPVLATALAAFDCRLIEAKEMSTHLILIGRVEAIEVAPKTEALLYMHRSYQQI